LLVAVPTAAVADGWVSCFDRGPIRITPGLMFVPGAVHFDATLELYDCTSSDPTIHGGVVVASIDSPAWSCAGGAATGGVATFYWDNGETSDLEWSVEGGAVAVAQGTIVGGSAFVGEPFVGYVAPASPDPNFRTACLSAEGFRGGEFAGFDQIGVPAGPGM
jgi:hypothetical protein